MTNKKRITTFLLVLVVILALGGELLLSLFAVRADAAVNIESYDNSPIESDMANMEEADYQAYKEKGYEFQLNLMSLSGYYGRRPQAVSEVLLKKGWYDYVGSDLHHLRRYAPMLESLKLKREQLDALSVLLENNHTI